MVWPWQRDRNHGRLTPRRRDASPGDPTSSAAVSGARPPGGQRSPLSDHHYVAGLRPIPWGDGSEPRPWPADRIRGFSPRGEPLEIVFPDQCSTLLCFLATRCDGCEEFWQRLRDDAQPILPVGVSYVIATRSGLSVDRAEVARFSEGFTRCPVVMSDEGWAAFEVFSYPFFVVLDGPSRALVAESVAFSWPDVQAMLASSI